MALSSMPQDEADDRVTKPETGPASKTSRRYTSWQMIWVRN